MKIIMTTSEKRKETIRKSQKQSRQEKKNNGMKQVSFYLEPDTLDKLKKECKSKGLSYSQFIKGTFENIPDKKVKQLSIPLTIEDEEQNITNYFFAIENELNSIQQLGNTKELSKVKAALINAFNECDMLHDFISSDFKERASQDSINFSFSFEAWLQEILIDLYSNTSTPSELEKLLTNPRIQLYKHYYEYKMGDHLEFEFEFD
jgi:hypothetical protein